MPVFESDGVIQVPMSGAHFEFVDGFKSDIDWDGLRPEKGYGEPPVRTVVDFIARNVSSLPLKTYRRVGMDARERVRDGNLAELVSSPNSGPLAPMRFWYSLVADGLLADRMLAIVEVKAEQRTLRRIPPSQWEIISDSSDQITGVRIFKADGRWRDLTLGNNPMILDVGYAYSGANGVAQAKTLKKVLKEYQESVEYRASVNKNTARAPFVVERDKPWPDKESRERFSRGMSAFVSGGGSAGSGMLLEDGMKIEALSVFKPIDVGDLDARDRVKIDVANAYGIPAEIMGLREGNFSNLEAYRQMLFGTYLRPYITAFEQAVDHGLRSLAGDGEYVEFDLDAQLRGNPEAQFAAMNTATGRPFMTTNEIRSRMNLPPVPGGDELVTPLNVAVGGQTSPQDGITAGRGGGQLAGLEEVTNVQEDV
ncbi:phage portal protein [Actinomycetaceae bacterium MB13-C1-2]|nr:phage portal protein [Actinomycetaceae bacterium MB13-C1-2]